MSNGGGGGSTLFFLVGVFMYWFKQGDLEHGRYALVGVDKVDLSFDSEGTDK